jgi:hypothetical protein
MAIKITDEALNDFDAASEEERTQFLSRLSEDDRKELEAARQNRAASSFKPPTSVLPESTVNLITPKAEEVEFEEEVVRPQSKIESVLPPERTVEQASTALASSQDASFKPPSPWTKREYEAAHPKDTFWQEMRKAAEKPQASLASVAGPLGTMLDSGTAVGGMLDTVRRHTLVPAWQAFQSVARPVINERALGYSISLQAMGVAPEKANEFEAVYRMSNQMFGGQEAVSDMDERELRDVFNLWEQRWGTKGAAYAQALAQELPKAPLFLVSTPLSRSSQAMAGARALATTGKTMAELPLLNRVILNGSWSALGNAVENAALNLPMAALDENKTFGAAALEGGIGGAVAGGGLSALGDVGGVVAKEALKSQRGGATPGAVAVGLATRRAMKQLGGELERVADAITIGGHKEFALALELTGKAGAAKAATFRRTEWKDGEKPSVYLFHVDKLNRPAVFSFKFGKDGKIDVASKTVGPKDFKLVDRIERSGTSWVASTAYAKVEPIELLRQNAGIIDDLDWKRATGQAPDVKSKSSRKFVKEDELPEVIPGRREFSERTPTADQRRGYEGSMTDMPDTHVQTTTELDKTQTTRGATEVQSVEEYRTIEDLPRDTTPPPAVVVKRGEQIDFDTEVTKRADLGDYRKQGFTPEDYAREDIPPVGGGSGKALPDSTAREGEVQRDLPPGNSVGPPASDPFTVHFEHGQDAYWRKKGTIDAPETVNYLHDDPANPNNAIVVRGSQQKGNARRESVPKSELYPTTAEGFSDVPVASIPVDNPSPETLGIVVDRVADAKARTAADMIKKARSMPVKATDALKGLWKRWMESPPQRVAAELEEIVLRAQSTKMLTKMQPKIEEQLRAFVGDKQDSGFDQWLTKVAKGEIQPDAITRPGGINTPEAQANAAKQAEYFKRFEKIRHVFKNYLDQVESNHQRIKSLLENEHEGLVHLPSRDEMDRYMATLYRAYTLPRGEWAKLAPSAIIERAAKFLHDRALLSGKQMAVPEIEAQLKEILNSEDPWRSFTNSTHGQAWKNLKHKESIPQPIKDLLGEETSFMVRMSTTLARQEAIINNLEIWAKIVDGGTLAAGFNKANKWWSPGPRSDLAGIEHRLPDNPLLFGKAANGYVHPDLVPLVEAAKFIEQPFTFMHELLGMTKNNLVALGGAKPWVNAIAESLLFNSSLCGGFTAYQPRKAGKYLAEAMMDFIRSGEFLPASVHNVDMTKIGNPARERVIHARKLGVDVAGLFGNEVGGNNSKFYRKLMQRLEAEGEKITLGKLLRLYTTTAAEFAKSTLNQGSHYYDFIDRAFRYGQWRALMADGLSDIEAAKRVNRFFPNMYKPSALAEKIRSSNAGFLARFATHPLEQMRVSANALEELMAEMRAGDCKMLGRLAAMTLLGSVAWSANKWMRRENGISDKEQENRLKATPDAWQARRSPGVTVLPVRDANGNLLTWDMGDWFWQSRLFKKDPDDPMISAFVGNLLVQLVAGGAAEDQLKEFISAATQQDWNDFKQKPLPGDESGFGALGLALASTGFVPGNWMRGYDALKKTQAIETGKNNKLVEQWTPGTAAANLLGLSVNPVGKATYKQAKLQKMMAAKEYKKNKIRISNADISPEKKKEAKAANKEKWQQEKLKKRERTAANSIAEKEKAKALNRAVKTEPEEQETEDE